MDAVVKGWILQGAFIPQVLWTAVYLHGELHSFQFKDPSGSYIRPPSSHGASRNTPGRCENLGTSVFILYLH